MNKIIFWGEDLKEVLHIKTNNVYKVISEEVINCTNSANDAPMVLYKNKEGKLFVRDWGEFNKKFTVISTGNNDG